MDCQGLPFGHKHLKKIVNCNRQQKNANEVQTLKHLAQRLLPLEDEIAEENPRLKMLQKFYKVIRCNLSTQYF